ncbi:MAG TPA: cytochrome D1 domain-containing protein [Gemmatimonadales bacterium]
MIARCLRAVLTALAASLLAGPAALTAQGRPGYLVGVVSESADQVTWLRPEGNGLVVDRVVPVGVMPMDNDGPHNLAVAPDGTSYYVSIAHGTPYGSLWKLDASGDAVLGRAPAELFPTTIALTPDGQYAFVANSDFHGDHPRENVITVVHTPTMRKITDLPACEMPHGVKVNRAGTRVYVSCMHGDEILEYDVATLGLRRRVSTGPGHCSPTFVSVAPDDRRLYVACNHANTLQAWDAETLRRIGEVPVGKGAYNVEPSPDGSVVAVTNKKDRSVSLVDARTLREIARVPTSKPVVHGIAFSPGGRVVYISSESVGADPGAVDVIDLVSRRVVASVAVPGQPTGIAVRALPPTSSTH